MDRWLNYFTFDVTGDLSFGVSLDCLEQKKVHFSILLHVNMS
jgi:hypothetical protein